MHDLNSITEYKRCNKPTAEGKRISDIFIWYIYNHANHLKDKGVDFNVFYHGMRLWVVHSCLSSLMISLSLDIIYCSYQQMDKTQVFQRLLKYVFTYYTYIMFNRKWYFMVYFICSKLDFKSFYTHIKWMMTCCIIDMRLKTHAMINYV
jgi:hypothetical protein